MNFRLILLPAFFCCSANLAVAFMQSPNPELTDFDKRADMVSGPDSVTPEQRRAVVRLQARKHEVQVAARNAFGPVEAS